MARDQARFTENLTAILLNQATVVDFSGKEELEEELTADDFLQIEAALAAHPVDSVVVCLKFNHCNLPSGSAPYLARIIKQQQGLRKLYLNQNHLNDEGVAVLVEALYNTEDRALQTLSLEGNFITAVGAASLTRLIAMDTLRELILDNNPLNNDGIEQLLARPNATAAENKNLLLLSLRACDIHPAGAQAMANIAKNYIGLTFLYLDTNPLFRAGVEALVNGLTPCTLRELHLEGCSMGNEGAWALGAMLQRSAPYLNVLNLDANKITSEGLMSTVVAGKGLVLGLANNKSLNCLSLAENGLADEGADLMGMVIAGSYVLENVDLNSNYITDVGAAKLARGLESSARITGLQLSDNPITDLGAEAFLKVLQARSADADHEPIELELDCKMLSVAMQKKLAAYTGDEDSSYGSDADDEHEEDADAEVNYVAKAVQNMGVAPPSEVQAALRTQVSAGSSKKRSRRMSLSSDGS